MSGTGGVVAVTGAVAIVVAGVVVCATAAFSAGTEARDISTGLFVSVSCVEAMGGEDCFVRFAFFAAGKGFV